MKDKVAQRNKIAKKAFSDPQCLTLTLEAKSRLDAGVKKTDLYLDQRLAHLRALYAGEELQLNSTKQTLHILDHKFADGLDFLLTWQWWNQQKQSSQHSCEPSAQLIYVAISEHPAPLDTLESIYSRFPQLKHQSQQLLKQYPHTVQGFHQLDFGDLQLILIQASAEQALAHINYDFDADINDVKIEPGPLPSISAAYQPPWQRSYKGMQVNVKQAGRATEKKKTTVAIVGAGISGVASAYSLAKKGFAVTLIEQGPNMASGASGNRQGMLYAKLPDNATIAGQFHQQGLQHSMGLLKRTLDTDYWQACGLLQLATTPKQGVQMQRVMQRRYPPSWLQWLEQSQAEQLARQPLSAGGLYFPSSGWVSPAHWCQALYQQSGAALQLNTQVSALHATQDQRWQLELCGQHSGLVDFDAVVIANANDAASLLPQHSIPLKSIRGQVSYVASKQSPALVVCGEGYVTPAQNGVFAAGASYNLHTNDTDLTQQDHLDNLGRLTEVLPQHAGLDLTAVEGGRVGFRCVTPDYLPMVGQLADESLVLERFAKLRQDSNYKFCEEMPYLKGLYINVGHGSKGLISAPLSAEILASQMANHALPVAQCVAWGIDPNRFIIRDLIRRKR